MKEKTELSQRKKPNKQRKVTLLSGFKKYFFLFQNRLQVGLQYRASAIAGFLTQMLWGLMQVFAYKAILETNPSASPMEFSQLVCYVWLTQSFLVMFNTWAADGDMFSMLVDGGIAYEMCRPVSIYSMWYAKTVGSRVAEATMRSIPILTITFLLPKPYNMSLPVSASHFLLFLITMVLGLFVTVAFCMFVYITAFFTISPQGFRMIMTGAVDFLSGAIIPLPFVPQPFRGILELLPFASMQNVPIRIYNGNLKGSEMWQAIGLQIFWAVTMILIGRFVCHKAERRVTVQGG